MHRPQGYVTIVGDCRLPVPEADSVVCGHCNVILLVKPGTAATVYLYPQVDGSTREADGAFCRQCMTHICLRCHKRGLCTPLLRRIDDMERRRRDWQTAGILG